MASFEDAKGRTWTVALNVTAARRVLQLAGVDLLKQATDGTIFATLADEPIVLCNVLYALCKPQADAEKISDEEFGRGLAGDAIDAATTALMGALIAFFPKRRRALYEKAAAKMDRLTDMAVAAAEKRLDSGELEEKMRKELDVLTSGEQSTSSPDSPDSTPAP